MKNLTRTALALSLVTLFSISMTDYAKAPPAVTDPGVVAKESGPLKKLIDSVVTKGPTYLCRKADFFGGKVSLRSFEGRICQSIKEAALLSYIICRQPYISADEAKGFLESGCYKKGFDTHFKGMSLAEAKSTLVNMIVARVPDSAKGLVCKVVAKPPFKSIFSPDQIKKIGLTCPEAAS